MKISQKQVNNLETDIAGKESTSNKVTTIDQNSTDTQYPSAKAVYDKVANIPSSDSPAFTGTPTAPTAAAGTNNTQIATTAYVDGALANSISQNGETVGMRTDSSQTTISNTAIKIKIGSTDYYVPATTGGADSITVGTCHGSCHGNCHGNCHGHCAGMKGVGI